MNKDNQNEKKLHLGCGTRYIEGYINIDHPPSEHSVQDELVADKFIDILELNYPDNSIDEIRLHHVFEHFPRQVALALLCRWTDWLKPGGILRIETPDALACSKAIASPFTSDTKRQQIMRHLFGSHEAAWAAHWDGWYEQKFRETLTSLGYNKLKFKKTRWGVLRNIEVSAIRSELSSSIREYQEIVEVLLKKSLIKHFSMKGLSSIADSEVKMLDVWLKEWRTLFLRDNQK